VKCFGERASDARRAAGDEDRIACEVHDGSRFLDWGMKFRFADSAEGYIG
jgi:hypothetical protein